jgi:3-keto-disaccharide hydrolase
VTKIDGIASNSQKRIKSETHFVLDIATLYPKESSGNHSLIPDRGRSRASSKVVEMTQEKCLARPALWAFALAGALAMVGAGAAVAAGNRMTAEIVPAAGAAASSGAATSDGTKVWDFDHDRGYQPPAGWTEISGQWRVLIDNDAPSEPNVLGLPGFGLPHMSQVRLWIDSFFSTNYLLAITKNPTEYTDFSYGASFKEWGGAWGSYAGLVFRYTDPQNYYVLAAACPKDYLALYRMNGGQLNLIKEVPADLARGQWYTFKVDAHGGHFIAYLNGKQMFTADDGTLTKGRIGLWSQNDSRVSFDNIELTPAAAGS